MDIQEQCRLFSIPLEIRHCIYSYLIPDEIHISHYRGKITISPCVAPKNAGDLDGSERRTTGDYETDAVWMRRLDSLWGPHWQCQEVSEREDGVDLTDSKAMNVILWLCKRMHTEVLDQMYSAHVFHITDLWVLDKLTRIFPSYGSPASQYGFLPAAIRRLNITLHIHGAFVHKLGSRLIKNISPRYAPELNATDREQLREWIRVWPALGLKLNRLQSVHLWLGRSDYRFSWGHINERVALVSFITSMSENDIADVCINLPVIHPYLANPERHYIKEGRELPENITIKRGSRLKYYCYNNNYVGHDVDAAVVLGHPEWEDLLSEDIAELEQDLWAAGKNVNFLLYPNKPESWAVDAD